jgi:hypothetical protein
VNALAIDIDGPRPGASCNTPPRNVPAALKEIAPGKFLGTMEGKFPEDPKRFELQTGKPGIAKTPFGWFTLRDASVSGDTMQLTIAAGVQMPPTMDDIRIIQRASMLLADPVKGIGMMTAPVLPTLRVGVCSARYSKPRRRSPVACTIASQRCRRCGRKLRPFTAAMSASID